MEEEERLRRLACRKTNNNNHTERAETDLKELLSFVLRSILATLIQPSWLKMKPKGAICWPPTPYSYSHSPN